MHVVDIINHILQVKKENNSYVVDLEEKTCSYCKFQALKIPCVHAIAACIMRKQPMKSICPKYTTQQRCDLWSSNIPNTTWNKWNLPTYVSNILVSALIMKKRKLKGSISLIHLTHDPRAQIEGDNWESNLITIRMWK